MRSAYFLFLQSIRFQFRNLWSGVRPFPFSNEQMSVILRDTLMPHGIPGQPRMLGFRAN